MVLPAKANPKGVCPAELMLVTGTSHFPLSEQDAPRTKVMIKGWLDRFFPSPLVA